MKTHVAAQYISEPLGNQPIRGTVRLRIWGQSLDPSQPATWAVVIRVVSRDGEQERGVLLPMTIGVDEQFGPDLDPLVIGPLALSPVDAQEGDRVVIELGSRGAARVEGRNDNQAWFEFSTDLLFEDLSTHFRDKRTSRKIGKCIYCGSTKMPLGDEHIIPQGLNGEFTLTAASCRAHEKVTSRFENDVLGNMFGSVRIALGMRSKRPNDRRTTLPILVNKGKDKKEIQVAFENYPAILSFPLFVEPAHLTQRQYSAGIEHTGATFVQVSGPSLAELRLKYETDYVGVRHIYQPGEFARLLAKIGYGFGILMLGADHFAERYVLPAILGEADDLGRWIGCDSSASAATPSKGLHTVGIRMEGKEINVMVRLFAQFGAPEYRVIVGRLR